MPRLKLPKSFKDEVESEKTTTTTTTSRKKAPVVDPKQTLMSSFFTPVSKSTKEIDNKEDKDKDKDKDNKKNEKSKDTSDNEDMVDDNNKLQKEKKATPNKSNSPQSPQTSKSPLTRRSSANGNSDSKLVIDNKEKEKDKSTPTKTTSSGVKKDTEVSKSIPPKLSKQIKKKPISSDNDIYDDEKDSEEEEEDDDEEEKVVVKKPSKPTSKSIIAKPASTKTTTTSTGRTRVNRMNLDISFSSESEEDEKPKKKTIGKKRKKKDDSDFDSQSDSDTISEASEVEHEPESDEDLDSFKFNSKKKNNNKNNNNKKKNEEYEDEEEDEDEEDELFKDIEMKDKPEEEEKEEEECEPIVIGSGRVVLPKGTPDFQPDPKAGKKLLKAHLEIQSKEEAKRLQQQTQANGGDGGGQIKGSDDEDEEVKKPSKGGSKASAKKKGPAYTPLEQQYIAIKKENPDTVLMVECGYKYKFFGEDAEVANKVLNIYSYVAKNFLNCSIPTQRLFFHLRRLVMAGYKVGIVEQTETAALKAISSSKSQPFERKLTRVYTSSTFIDDDIDDQLTSSSPQFLVSFYESAPKNKNDDVIKKQRDSEEEGIDSSNESSTSTISFVAVSVKTGEIIYDTFKDNVMRSQLETILTHIKPSEILIPPTTTTINKQKVNNGIGTNHHYYFSNLTSKCLKTYTKSTNVRTQAMDSQLYDYEYSLGKLIDFYEDESSNNSEDVLEFVKSTLNKEQIICLGILLSYLNEFIHFGSILKVKSNFKAFRVSNHLVLPHSTIVNLELLVNESDNKEKGSLVWLMNRTSTFSGSRMFINWICKPLNQLELIKDRQDAVEELVNGIKTNSPPIVSIISLFKSHIPDLQRNLSRIYYKVQCTPKEFLNTMTSLQRIVELFKEINNNNSSSDKYKFNSILLNSIFKLQNNNKDGGDDNDNFDYIGGSEDILSKRIKYFLSNINKETAKEYGTVGCDKSNLWVDLEKYEKIRETKEKIEQVEKELKIVLKNIRKELSKPSLEYHHMPGLGLEYLLELPPSFKAVPKSWIKVNSTQKMARYHAPEVLEQLKILSQSRETLKIQSQESWISFLGEFSADYSLFSNFVNKISNLDCLFSLAKVSSLEGYIRPQFVKEKRDGGILIENGRHPVVEAILSGSDGSYVPNTIELRESACKSMIITGPNMGGKSSLLRQTALIVIMAQVGCFVPATSCSLSVFDAIYTRMGARDSIGTGKSTFFIELEETSDILKNSTQNTLVILDELGRGTSTNDGVAIAYSTLKYIVEVMKCYCLFVTHYPLLAQLELQYPTQVGNFHMGYLEEKQDQQQLQKSVIPKVIFLYKLVKGAAQNSYGLNIARLAGLPMEIIADALKKSNQMKESITRRANLSDCKDQQQIENEIKSIIKNWNSNRTTLNSNDLSKFIEKFKSIQLKL
ncbi:hypothetical protein ACTFIY_007556 [Dictyostelium cf. discoideum]